MTDLESIFHAFAAPVVTGWSAPSAVPPRRGGDRAAPVIPASAVDRGAAAPDRERRGLTSHPACSEHCEDFSGAIYPRPAPPRRATPATVTSVADRFGHEHARTAHTDGISVAPPKPISACGNAPGVTRNREWPHRGPRDSKASRVTHGFCGVTDVNCHLRTVAAETAVRRVFGRRRGCRRAALGVTTRDQRRTSSRTPPWRPGSRRRWRRPDPSGPAAPKPPRGGSSPPGHPRRLSGGGRRHPHPSPTTDDLVRTTLSGIRGDRADVGGQQRGPRAAGRSQAMGS